MALFVYALCLLTALGCAVVLFAAYRRTGTPLVLWSGLCFLCLAANELLVLVDIYVIPDTSLLLLRRLAGLGAVSLMLVGLISHMTETPE